MPGKILVVEDSNKNRRLLADVLRRYGYEVMEARNGAEAVKTAREHLPDLILMDVLMPVMDGIVAGKMLKNDPATKRIRIIALTSFALSGDKETFMKTGFDDYLSKPIDMRQLPEIVKLHLGLEVAS